jgi:uncharacterized protein (DUF1330 family)
MTGKRVALAAAFVAVAVVSGLASQRASTKAYILMQVEISNPQRYGEYMKVTPGLIEKFGGRFLARGGRAETLEGAPAKGRVVVVEFESFDRAQEFYNSPEYQAARKLRADAATAQMIVVEGL